MNIRKIATLLLVALAGIIAQAQPRTIDPTVEFNAKLAAQSKVVKTIKCNFSQTKHAAALTKDARLSGVFYYNNDGRMCLLYSEPRGNQIVINGDRFAIETAGKRNVVSASSNPMLRQLSLMLRACMTGDVAMFNSGWQARYSEQGAEYIVELLPQDKRAKKYVSKVVLNFNKKDMSLNKMMMVEASGDYSNYEFTDKVFNVAIEESVFKI